MLPELSSHIEVSYKSLLARVFYNGESKDDRTGTGTKALFGETIKHNFKFGFPLLTTKKMYFKHVVTELLWMLEGRTDLEYLHKNGLTYWDKNYKVSGRSDRTLGKIYGYQWRNFNGVDQLQTVLEQIRDNPSSRRIILNMWNASDLPDMSLPPCPYSFQIQINNGLMNLLWIQRSADVFLGLPYDIAIYGLLLCLLAKGSCYKPGMLIGQLGDCHLYNNHLEQTNEYLHREAFKLPDLISGPGVYLEKNGSVHIPDRDEIYVDNYNYHSAIKAELAA